MMIRTWQNHDFVNVEIDIEEIVEFGIVNRKLYNNNGSFKKWYKDAFVQMDNGKVFFGPFTDDIAELKQLLKGKFTAKKDTYVTYKKGEERKATNWTYTIIKRD